MRLLLARSISLDSTFNDVKYFEHYDSSIKHVNGTLMQKWGGGGGEDEKNLENEKKK
jgi:hypothetical protein